MVHSKAGIVYLHRKSKMAAIMDLN